MADVRVSQLPLTPAAANNSFVATTGSTTIRVQANSVNSNSTVVIRDNSGSSGFNTVNCNTLNGVGAKFSGTVESGFFKGDGSQLTNLNVGDGVPVGTIILYGGVFPPAGYINCDGRTLSRTTYLSLFNVIGTYYGTGNGSTTFNVPDFRGRVPVGVGQGTSLTNRVIASRFGAETHLLTANESGLRAHSHRQNMGRQRHRNQDNGHGMSGGAVDSGFNTANAAALNALNAHNNLQPSLVVGYFIKII